VPDWVAPFDSAQFRSLLAATILPSQCSNWRFANAGPSHGQLLLPTPDQVEEVAQQGSDIQSRNKSKKNKEKEREDSQEDSRKKRKLSPMSVSRKHTFPIYSAISCCY
jgi:hypothetical protein